MTNFSDKIKSKLSKHNFAFGRPDPPGTIYSLYKIINNKSTEIANSPNKYQMLVRKAEMEEAINKTIPKFVVRTAKNLWS